MLYISEDTNKYGTPWGPPRCYRSPALSTLAMTRIKHVYGVVVFFLLHSAFTRAFLGCALSLGKTRA